LRPAFLRAFGRVAQAAPWDNEESIREELFSIERLEQHAESLAAAQPVSARPMAGRSLAVRLRDNESVLLKAYRAIASAVGEGRGITPAAEWLLDNYHLVEQQIREIRDDLPPAYYRHLPKLATGPFAGYPRVFGIAWAFVAHTDSRFDPEMLRRFVRAYQRVQPLTIGELWAVAITLRIVLVENLRRGARRIVTSRAARQEADALADRLLGVNARPAEPFRPVFQHYEQAPLPGAFAVQLVQRLRRCDRARRAPKTGRHERDGPQRHHEHAADLRLRLGGARRERQSCRRHVTDRQRLREHGFPDAQPLPHRDRGAGAGLETDGNGDCASGSSGRKRSGA